MSNSYAALKKAPDAGIDATVDGGANDSPPLSYTAGSFIDITTLTANQTATTVASGDASPWILGTSKYVYHYNNDTSQIRAWGSAEPNSANTLSLAVSPEGNPWRIDSNHHVFEHSGAPGSGIWNAKGATFQAYEIAVGPNDDAWAIAYNGVNQYGDYPIYQWAGSAWQLKSGAGQHIAVPPDGSTTWVSNAGGYIYKWVSNAWQYFGACAQRLSDGAQMGRPILGAAANDALWVLGCSGPTNNIWAWHTQNSFWENVTGNATSISVSADGTPWVTDSVNHVYEYVSTWQNVGPHGFSFVDDFGVQQIYTGEVHDINASPTTGAVTIGVTSGGVWQTPPTFGWVPIGDSGAGSVIRGGQIVPAGPGPFNSVGTIAVKPSDQNTVIVGTGVAGALNGPNAVGNGIWVTHEANATQVPWTKSTVHSPSGAPITPPTIVKIRYSNDGGTIFALSTTGAFVSTDQGATFNQAPTSGNCAPTGSDVFTDLVVDPQNSNIAYFGVSGEGVYQAANVCTGGSCALSCSHGNPPPLFNGTASSITMVALAITSSSVLYAALAGNPLPFDSGDNFQNIDSTSTATWPTWTTPVSADSIPHTGNSNIYYGLNSQGGHNWALGTNPTGNTILLGGISLHRWTGCSATQCTNVTLLCEPDNISPTPDCPSHHDYHAIVWGQNGWVYVANDGGLFYSTDAGITWNAQANSFGVANEKTVSVSAANIVADAWDVGGHFSTDDGTTWLSDVAISTETDGRQAVADPSSTSAAYLCQASGGNNARYAWDGTSWTEIDHAPVSPADTCVMAKSYWGDLFTTGSLSSQDNVFHSANHGQSWASYPPNCSQTGCLVQAGPPWSVVLDNRYPTPAVYAISSIDKITVSVNGGAWLPAVRPNWPANYQFVGANAGQTPGAAAVTDALSFDLYVAGQKADKTGTVISESPSGSFGTSWTPLTGVTGIPGVLKQDEKVTTLAVDPSAHAVLTGTDGTAAASTTYGSTSIWRLNNPGVVDVSHHWRPWTNGLPVGSQATSWITGQYENGTYYFYLATWGRGVWKREARGGDL